MRTLIFIGALVFASVGYAVPSGPGGPGFHPYPGPIGPGHGRQVAMRAGAQLQMAMGQASQAANMLSHRLQSQGLRMPAMKYRQFAMQIQRTAAQIRSQVGMPLRSGAPVMMVKRGLMQVTPSFQQLGISYNNILLKRPFVDSKVRAARQAWQNFRMRIMMLRGRPFPGPGPRPFPHR